MSTFQAPTDRTTPWANPNEQGKRSWMLFRHFGNHAAGRNIYYLTTGVVTDVAPADWTTVDTVWWGGHEAVTVTAAQATALTNAGYTVT